VEFFIDQYKQRKSEIPSSGWKLSTHVGPD
jgi:hypothetical protein